MMNISNSSPKEWKQQHWFKNKKRKIGNLTLAERVLTRKSAENAAISFADSLLRRQAAFRLSSVKEGKNAMLHYTLHYKLTFGILVL